MNPTISQRSKGANFKGHDHYQYVKIFYNLMIDLYSTALARD